MLGSDCQALSRAGSARLQLSEQRRKQRAAFFLPGFAEPGQLMRDIEKPPAGTVAGGDFRDHLAIVGGGAEQSRIERNACNRLALHGLCKSALVNFRTLRHADLIKAV